MYEQQYGLNRRPFSATASGPDVFVGPQTARLMQVFKKALVSNDATVTVMGPTGVGKTTLVNRAIDAMPGAKKIVRIGRMQLGHDEVLDFLLDEFQAQNVPASTIRKISLFRRLLAEHAAAGTRVYVVVEDAVRIGEDALAEFEALTAADGGDCAGANLILMGGRTLKPLLERESLARLHQRVRVYHTLNPLIAAELLGYFKHCFRLAGGEFDLVFPEGSAQFIHALTGGVPRIANNLVESVMNAGNDLQLARVDMDLIARVADEEYGLTADMPEAVSASPVITADPEPVAEAEPAETAEPESVPVLDTPVAEPEPVMTTEPEPVPIPAVQPAAPEPVADTAPESELAIAAEPEPVSIPADQPTAPEPIAEMLPEPVIATEPEPAPAIETPVPEPVAEKAPEPEPVIATEFEAAPVIETPAPEPVAETAPEPEPDIATDPEPALSIEIPDSEPAAPISPEPEPVVVADLEPIPESPAAAESGRGLPELIQDTMPDLPILNTPPAGDSDAQVAKAEAHPAVEKDDDIPTLFDSGSMDAPAADDIPDFDKDPTLAQLRPDVEALEEAMANLAEPDEADAPPTQVAATENAPDAPATAPEVDDEIKDPTMPSLPKITLDDEIDEKVKEASASLDMGADSAAQPDSSDAASIAAANPAQEADPKFLKSTTELRNIASGLSKAKTLEDMDDELAETLFGSEINAIAEQVLAKGANQDWLNEGVDAEATTGTDLELEPTMNGPAATGAAPEPAPPDAAPETPASQKTELEKEFMDVYGENALEVSLETDTPNAGLDLSASQRLATVRALNADKLPPAARPPLPANNGADGGSQPESFEDQIKTSMTQTFAALNVRPTAVNDDDDEDEENEKPKGGFFSRFRRS